MKIFLDTADIEEIRTAARWGVLDGVTTNPTLYAKVGGSYDEILKEVCKITSGPGLGRGRRGRRRGDARRGPPLRDARAEHRRQGRDERERPRGDQPLRRGGHQDQLHADLHGEPGPARGEGRGEPAVAVRRPARRHQPGRDDRHPRAGRDRRDPRARHRGPRGLDPQPAAHDPGRARRRARRDACRSRSSSRWSTTRSPTRASSSSRRTGQPRARPRPPRPGHRQA